MSSWFKSPPPKLVEQDRNQFHCWAASLESWIDCARPNTPMAAMVNKQRDLINAYRNFTGARDGLVVAKALMHVMFDYQMMVDVHAPGAVVTGAKVAQRLYTKGYLWLFYVGGALSEDLGHCEVVYGISDAHLPKARLHTMDPWFGTLDTLEIADLKKCRNVFVCWKETSATWSDDMFRIMSAVVKSQGVT